MQDCNRHKPSQWDAESRFGDDPFRADWSANHPIRTMIANKAMLGQSVLECGCASCIDIKYYNGTDMKYTGIDITLNFIRGAKRHDRNVDVRYGNILAIPFVDSSFDTVYASNVFEHLNSGEWVLAISEMWRVARKQILLALYIVPDSHPMEINKDGWGFNIIKYNIHELLEVFWRCAAWRSLEMIRDIGDDNRILFVLEKAKC